VILAFNQTNAQESKAYLGVSLGLAFPGGDAESLNGVGVNLGLINFGYRFSESWGATLNLTSSGFAYEDVDSAALGVGVFSVGPMYTANLSETISLDLKPQYAFSIAGKTKGLDDELDNVTAKGTGFVLGSSLNFGVTKGIKFSINLDYTSGKWNKVEYDGRSVDVDSDNKISALALGAGIRYNF
jgi:opacity protein-like surface antigen